MAFKNLWVSVVFLISLTGTCYSQEGKVWSLERAKTWYAKQPWYVGCNFIPSTAINQLEMWQAESFDTATISRELGWASAAGMNCARVFLHDLLYQQDSAGFLKRMDLCLRIADRHGIKIMFVFFDSVWDPYPYSGKQRDPKPGVHNSGWVQSPGLHALRDSGQDKRLETYIRSVVRRFAMDNRIFCWDVWNEPDNMNSEPYRSYEPINKPDLVTRLMEKVFAWIRAEKPSQPLTSCIWDTENSTNEAVRRMQKVQIDNSDIITFHSYSPPDGFNKLADKLSLLNRPLICTEFMARGSGSTILAILPEAKKRNIGIMCWGLVDGKTNTIHDWGTWRKPDKGEPTVWHHDIFRKDGNPYSDDEISVMKKLTGRL